MFNKRTKLIMSRVKASIHQNHSDIAMEVNPCPVEVCEQDVVPSVSPTEVVEQLNIENYNEDVVPSVSPTEVVEQLNVEVYNEDVVPSVSPTEVVEQLNVEVYNEDVVPSVSPTEVVEQLNIEIYNEDVVPSVSPTEVVEQLNIEIYNEDVVPSVSPTEVVEQPYIVIYNEDGVQTQPMEIAEDGEMNTETRVENCAGASTERRKRKAVVNIKKERQIKRNLGLEYVSHNGKVKSKRQFSRMEMCRKKCSLKFTFSEQESIFNDYWGLGDFNKRVVYMSSLITDAPKKTARIRSDGQTPKARAINHKYHLRKGGSLFEVCKICFQKTLNESNKFITTVISKQKEVIAAITPKDARGSGTPANKVSESRQKVIRDHINSYPVYESHYSRRDTGNQKFLPSGLTIQMMFNMYKEKTEDPVSICTFTNVFKSTGLKIKQPALDTCNTCDTYQMKIKIARANGLEGHAEASLLDEECKKHVLEADSAYQQKAADKAKVTTRNRVFCFDLQQCLPTPRLKTNIVFYKRQLWTYNLTVYDCGEKSSTCYMWHEAEGGRGANQIASCIFDFLLTLPPEVTEVTLYSDSCAGQNKNSHMAAMFLCLVQKRPDMVVNHKFLVPGHTHMECDSVHATIERKIKSTTSPLHVPRDWYNLVRGCGRKENSICVRTMSHDKFLNFADLLKGPLQIKKSNALGEKFLWQPIKWLQFRGEESGIAFYKRSLKEEEAFDSVSFERRGRRNVSLNPSKLYDSPVPINKDKKKDLLSILHLIDRDCHAFYLGLRDSVDIPYTDPQEIVDLND